MGYVMVYCTGWVLDRVPRTKETLFDFVKLWIPINGTQRVVLSYTTSTSISWVDG